MVVFEVCDFRPSSYMKKLASMWAILSWLLEMTQRQTPLLRAHAPKALLVDRAATEHRRTVRYLHAATLAPCPLPLPPLLS